MEWKEWIIEEWYGVVKDGLEWNEMNWMICEGMGCIC